MGLFRESVVTFATRISITLVNIPISMIIARVLGAEGQGVFSAAVTFPALWAGFGLLGLDAAHLYFLARDRRRLGPILGNSLVVLLVGSVLLLPTYLLLLGPLLGPEVESIRPYLLLSALIVPLIVARHFILNVFLGLGRVELYNGFLLLSQIALLLMVAFGLLAAGGRERFVLVAYQASLLLFVVPSILWIRRQMTAEDRVQMRTSGPLFRQSLAYGLKGHLGSVLSQFSYRFDMVLVLRWLGLAEQGYYSIAVLLAEKLSHITSSVQFVLFPRISASNREQADQITPLVCRSTFYCVALAGVAMVVAGKFLIRLFYGSTYAPSLAPLYALVPGIVALTLSNVLASDLSGRNRRVQVTLGMAFGFALNLILNVLWIRRLGIVGAALASTVSYTVQSLVMSLFFWQITGIAPHRLVWPGREDLDLYKRLLGRWRNRQRM